jgi:prophage antirepressor-like protein
MENAVMIFEFENKKIRTKLINDEPWFCLKDVCDILELQSSDVTKRLKQDGMVSIHDVDSLGRKSEMLFINESALYKAIFQSRKPEAEKFTDKVTEEILPELRKNGIYGKKLTPSEIVLYHAQKWVDMEREQEEIKRRQSVLEENVYEITTNLPSQIQSAINYTLDKMTPDFNRRPDGTLSLTEIRQKYFHGMSEPNISKWLSLHNHPTRTITVLNDSKQVIPSDMFVEEGLEELVKKFYLECTYVKRTEINTILNHPSFRQEGDPSKMARIQISLIEKQISPADCGGLGR